MSNRILSFRAALVLLLSSAVIIWPISFWFPIGDFLAAVNSADYAQFSGTLKGIVVVYFLFFMLNIVSAALAFTKLDNRVKFTLALTPAIALLAVPLILVIPVAQSPELASRGYFTVFEAMFRLLRFTTQNLFMGALIITAVAILINVFASILFWKDKSGQLESGPEVPSNLKRRYGFYVAASLVVLVVIGANGYGGATLRSLDRAACNKYIELPLPDQDTGVPAFLSNLQFIGESAGSARVGEAFLFFVQTSKIYNNWLNSEDPTPNGDELLNNVRVAKDAITEACSPYSVK